MGKPTAIVICPGRGTYNRDELGYLARYHPDRADRLQDWDNKRLCNGMTRLIDLDRAQTYSANLHTRGDNAAPLIFASAFFDYLELVNSELYEIVAITGNSMGWYIALGCSGVFAVNDAFKVVETMGQLTHEAMRGGQTIYPYMDRDWLPIPGMQDKLIDLVDEISDLHISIIIGGLIVFAGSTEALKTIEARLDPVDGRFPMRLPNHAAFHSPLQQEISNEASPRFPQSMFNQPSLPLIDGRGHVWLPDATDPADIHAYTFGHQVVFPYDFNAAIRTALHEFSPDVLIALGPGKTLGAPIGQNMVTLGWRGIGNKSDFQAQQNTDPVLLMLGDENDREKLI